MRFEISDLRLGTGGEGGANGEGGSREDAEGWWGGGWQAHSVRRESCDGSQQSRAFGGLVRRGRVRRGPTGTSAFPGLFGGGLAGALRAQREL